MNGKIISMSKNYKRLSESEAQAAALRRRQYEASMAIEGIHLTPDEKEFVAYIEKERIDYDDAIALAIEWLDKRDEQKAREGE